MQKPPALQPGDTIGIISPASSPMGKKAEHYERGVAALRSFGYQVVEAPHARGQHGYLAAEDSDRAADIMAMLTDPAIKAVFCSRGGYGITRLLARLDFNRLTSPKILTGYSDITALHLALYSKAGWITFAGPMVAVEFGAGILEPTFESMQRLLGGQIPALAAMDAEQPFHTIQSGVAEGLLLGGCLSVLVTLLGTPYLPDFSGAILIVEDIGEPFYKIDRYFSQLENAGILEKIGGLILGQFVDLESDTNPNPIQFDEVISRYIESLDIPVLANFPYGHVPLQHTLPFGCRVRLDAGAGTVELLESGVMHAIS